MKRYKPCWFDLKLRLNELSSKNIRKDLSDETKLVFVVQFVWVQFQFESTWFVTIIMLQVLIAKIRMPYSA